MPCVYCYCVRFHGPGICHVCIATVLDSVDQVYVMCVLLLCLIPWTRYMPCVYCYCVRFHGPGICHVCIATVLDSMDQVYAMCVLLLC